MPSLAELSGKGVYLKMLGYGDSEIGKTRFIATMTKVFEAKRIYVMNFDPQSNLASIMTAAERHKEMANAKDIQFDNFTDYDTFLRKVVDLKRTTPCPFDMICLDGGGALQKVVMAYVLKMANHETATLPDYQVLHERTRSRIKELVDLQAHSYMTFHAAIEKDEIQGKVIGRLNLMGSTFPEEVPCYFNMFLHFACQPVPGGQPKRRIECSPGMIFPAGERFESLDAHEEPDFKIMWDKISKNVKSLVQPRRD